MKEDTNKIENCQICGNYICKCEVKPFENKSDTNTLREEWNKTAPKGMPQEYMDLVATYWLNKFNQKLKEIEQEIEKCSDFADSGDTLKQRILQIIKNKKI